MEEIIKKSIDEVFFVIDSDKFLDMPLSTQALYLHLLLRANDIGFINNPKSIMRQCRASEVDFNLLIEKQFLREEVGGGVWI